jgi:hypothetical protein
MSATLGIEKLPASNACLRYVRLQQRVYRLAAADVSQGSPEELALEPGSDVRHDDNEARMDFLAAGAWTTAARAGVLGAETPWRRRLPLLLPRG